VQRDADPRATPREVGLTVTCVAALLLAAFTAGDGYFTAKHFHHPAESAATAVAVLLLYQAPVLGWLVWERRRTAAADGKSVLRGASAATLAAAAAPAFAS